VRRALAGAIFKWESQNNMSKVGLARVMIAIIASAGLSACVTLPPNSPRSPHDPWESWNRGVYKVNDKLDRAVLKPVAVGYVHHVPSPIRTGVRNFFSNIGTVRTMINDALQGKFKAAGNDLGRFALNTTVGIGGLFDPASSAGLDRNNEDFGLTLGHWGVHAGPFLELPLLGPSDLRDGPSKIADYFSNPLHYVDNDWVDYGLDVPWAIDARSMPLSSRPSTPMPSFAMRTLRAAPISCPTVRCRNRKSLWSIRARMKMRRPAQRLRSSRARRRQPRNLRRRLSAGLLAPVGQAGAGA
jgi:phospholipid-binding lipoprotein MlaA